MNLYAKGFTSGPPEPASDAVLAVRLDFQEAMPDLHGLLDMLFQHAGFQTVPFCHAGNPMGFLFVHICISN
jgi:hypothetical protein